MTRSGDGLARNTARGSHLRAVPAAAMRSQHAQRASNPAKPDTRPWDLPSSQRDALTGAPLRADLPVLLVRDWRLASEDARNGRAYRDIPRQIDTSRPYDLGEPTTVASRRNYLGGLEWTPEAKRFFKAVLPRGIEEAYRLWDEWWQWPYIVAGLRRELGEEKLAVALCICRDGENERTVAVRYRHTLHWVAYQKRNAERIVRRRYLPHDWLKRIHELAALIADMERDPSASA